MKQGFELKRKTKKIQVVCHQGKQKEKIAIVEDEGLVEARKYYKHMERFREINREILGLI